MRLKRGEKPSEWSVVALVGRLDRWHCLILLFDWTLRHRNGVTRRQDELYDTLSMLSTQR
jgi:hypothetical protein